jgi:hypothetical protein
MTIGSAAVISLAEASKMAREFLAQAASGVNLIEERRRKDAKEKAAESVLMVFARYLAEYAREHMRPDYYKQLQHRLGHGSRKISIAGLLQQIGQHQSLFGHRVLSRASG